MSFHIRSALHYRVNFNYETLFGDSDVRALVEIVQRHGVRMTVVSTITNKPPILSDALRRQVDMLIDFAALRGKFRREV